MKIAYFDCFAGISGDMCLGALIDAGLKLDYLNQELSKLCLEGYTLQTNRVLKNGLSGTKLDVIIKDGYEKLSYPKMLDLIKKTSLADPVKLKASTILKRLAEAEAKVHNINIDGIHFHEIGELDTIIDVLGTIVGLSALGIEAIYSSALNLGSGEVKTQHGLLPVPAPATVELIKGALSYSSGIKAELTTPTGAAIITTLAQGFGDLPVMRVEKTGYGAGSFDLPRPNLLRIIIGRTEEGYEQDIVTLIETNIDDSNPQIFGYLMEQLFEAGALDVYLTPIQMKKSRPAVLLSVLANQSEVNRLAEIILKETSSIGLRYAQMMRQKLHRQEGLIETRYGQVKVNIARGNGNERITPEYEDCKRIALSRNVPLREVYNEVVKRT